MKTFITSMFYRNFKCFVFSSWVSFKANGQQRNAKASLIEIHWTNFGCVRLSALYIPSLALRQDDKLSLQGQRLAESLWRLRNIAVQSWNTRDPRDSEAALIYWSLVPTLPVLLERSTRLNWFIKFSIGGFLALHFGYIFYGPINKSTLSKLQDRHRRWLLWWLWRKIWMVY